MSPQDYKIGQRLMDACDAFIREEKVFGSDETKAAYKAVLELYGKVKEEVDHFHKITLEEFRKEYNDCWKYYEKGGKGFIHVEQGNLASLKREQKNVQKLLVQYSLLRNDTIKEYNMIKEKENLDRWFSLINEQIQKAELNSSKRKAALIADFEVFRNDLNKLLTQYNII